MHRIQLAAAGQGPHRSTTRELTAITSSKTLSLRWVLVPIINTALRQLTAPSRPVTIMVTPLIITAVVTLMLPREVPCTIRTEMALVTTARYAHTHMPRPERVVEGANRQAHERTTQQEPRPLQQPNNNSHRAVKLVNLEAAVVVVVMRTLSATIFWARR